MQQRIVFIGGGNMAASLIGGLLADGTHAASLAVVEPQAERRAWLHSQFAVSTHAQAAPALAQAEVVVLAVKPQIMGAVARTLAPLLPAAKPLCVSIAAGIRLRELTHWLGSDVPLVRCMPNTPALIGVGASALFAQAQVSASQRDAAEHLLRAVGTSLWVEDERQLDAVTAISGSGPAYFFAFMEALEAAGTELGLPPATARLLTQQTALGAARMALESDDPPALLRQRVTSKGGTTAAALEQFEAGGLAALVQRAAQAAQQRSCSMAEEFGQAESGV